MDAAHAPELARRSGARPDGLAGLVRWFRERHTSLSTGIATLLLQAARALPTPCRLLFATERSCTRWRPPWPDAFSKGRTTQARRRHHVSTTAHLQFTL
jgi:hypothetical protein